MNTDRFKVWTRDTDYRFNRVHIFSKINIKFAFSAFQLLCGVWKHGRWSLGYSMMEIIGAKFLSFPIQLYRSFRKSMQINKIIFKIFLINFWMKQINSGMNRKNTKILEKNINPSLYFWWTQAILIFFHYPLQGHYIR